MKKLLILILIALVLTLTIFTMVNGLGIGGLKILGIKQIQDKNTELEKSVTEATPCPLKVPLRGRGCNLTIVDLLAHSLTAWCQACV